MSTTTTVKARTTADVSALMRRAIKSGKVADVSAAVDAALSLDKIDSDELRDWVRDNLSAARNGAADTAATVETLTSEAEDLNTRLKKLREDKAEAAKKLRAESADEVRRVYRIVVVHKLVSQSQLADIWSVGRPYMSNVVATAKAAAALGSWGQADINRLKKARKDQSKALSAALASDGATRDSVFAALDAAKSAAASAPQTSSQTDDADDDSDADLTVEASKLVERVTNVLVHLNKTGQTLADLDKITGADAARHLKIAIDAYVKRTTADAPKVNVVHLSDHAKVKVEPQPQPA